MTLEITCDNLEVLHLVKYNTHRLCVVFALPVPNVEFLLIKVFVLLDKFCKIYQVVWNHVIRCYDINVIFISSRKDGLLKFVKSNIFIKTFTM